MPPVQMTETSREINWNQIAAGGAGGVAGMYAYQKFEDTKKRASWGAGLSTAHAAMAFLGGQDALNEANASITAANAIQTTAAPATADGALIRTALLAQGRALQKLSLPAQIGLSTQNQTTTSSTLTAAAPQTTYLGLAIVVAAYFAFRD